MATFRANKYHPEIKLEGNRLRLFREIKHCMRRISYHDGLHTCSDEMLKGDFNLTVATKNAYYRLRNKPLVCEQWDDSFLEKANEFLRYASSNSMPNDAAL